MRETAMERSAAGGAGRGPDRRAVLAGLAALAGSPLFAGGAAAAVAGSGARWTLATQILAGTRPRDATLTELAVAALEREAGAETVEKLLVAVLGRDADDIGAPFADAAVEAAARRFVEMVYTGELPAADGTTTGLGFHQALAWQVLRFTKPPSVCGPGFGWWADAPDVG